MTKKKTPHKAAAGKASARPDVASKRPAAPATARKASDLKAAAQRPAAQRPAAKAKGKAKTKVAEPAPEPRPKAANKKSPYSKAQLHPLHDDLLLRRARLLRDLNLMEDEALREGTPEIDSDSVADLGSDAYERNLTLGLMEADARTLRQIDSALRAMEEGRYGLCEVCSEAIPLARLEALPFATTCVPCQQIHEGLR